MDTNWSDILKLALTTGLITTVINQGAGWLRDNFRDRAATNRDARYLALRVAIILESWVEDCAEVISSNELFRESRGTAGQTCTSLPALLAYPSDADWKALRPRLMDRALTFPNEIRMSNRHLASASDFIEWEDIPDLCDDEAGIQGYRAWELACDLRRAYGHRPYDPSDLAWDVVGLLKKSRDKALHRRKLEAQAVAQSKRS